MADNHPDEYSIRAADHHILTGDRSRRARHHLDAPTMRAIPTGSRTIRPRACRLFSRTNLFDSAIARLERSLLDPHRDPPRDDHRTGHRIRERMGEHGVAQGHGFRMTSCSRRAQSPQASIFPDKPQLSI
jgi:hypothetical protein